MKPARVFLWLGSFGAPAISSSSVLHGYDGKSWEATVFCGTPHPHLVLGHHQKQDIATNSRKLPHQLVEFLDGCTIYCGVTFKPSGSHVLPNYLGFFKADLNVLGLILHQPQTLQVSGMA